MDLYKSINDHVLFCTDCQVNSGCGKFGIFDEHCCCYSLKDKNHFWQSIINDEGISLCCEICLDIEIILREKSEHCDIETRNTFCSYCFQQIELIYKGKIFHSLYEAHTYIRKNITEFD